MVKEKGGRVGGVVTPPSHSAMLSLHGSLSRTFLNLLVTKLKYIKL
jgi:hypothetical protein